MILVTGGTGLVGSHLLYQLVQNHDRVRATYRTDKKIDAVKHVFGYYSENPDQLFSKIEWVEATLNDLPKLEAAFKGISYVYHCAALVSFDPGQYHELRKINIEGTANIVNLSVSHGVKKMCYVSSVAATGQSENGQEISEETPGNPEADHSVYAITIYGAELEVWRCSQEGVPVVIVNPGIIVGPGFWRASSGSLIKLISKGLTYYTTAISGYVDIEDVVNPMIQLMESSIENERYILVSENMPFKDFATKVSQDLGVEPPKKRVKSWQLKIGWRLDWLNAFLRKKRRKLTKQMAFSLLNDSIYSNVKMKKDLEYNNKSMEESIKESCRLFLKDHT